MPLYEAIAAVAASCCAAVPVADVHGVGSTLLGDALGFAEAEVSGNTGRLEAASLLELDPDAPHPASAFTIKAIDVNRASKPGKCRRFTLCHLPEALRSRVL